jgi:Undecaprenyl-phosphate glucose phosphotransferase
MARCGGIKSLPSRRGAKYLLTGYTGLRNVVSSSLPLGGDEAAGLSMLADVSMLGGGSARRCHSHVDRIDLRTIADGFVRLGDIGIVVASGLLATQLRFAGADQPDIVAAALLIGALLGGCIFSLLKIYDVERLTQLEHQLSRLLGGWAATIVAVLTVLYSIKSAHDLSRLWVSYWLLAGGVGFVAWRVLVRCALRKMQAGGRLRRNLVLVGGSRPMAACLAHFGPDMQGSRISAVLVLDDECPALPDGCSRIQNPVDLERTVREAKADQVILTVPLDRTSEILPLLHRLRHLSVEVSLYPDLAGADLSISGLTRLGDAPLLQLSRRPIDGWSSLLKCLEDRLLALALLVLAAPLLGLIAAAIKLTSPGPILYRQLRHGFHRQPISVLKFRTMYADLCDAPGAPNVQQATRDDPRVTPIGRILRRTSFDELPQLLNVLRGEMSLVGPRPHALAHDDQYSSAVEDYLVRHRVKPGITGWAQIHGFRGEIRSHCDIRRRTELDLEYIKNWSIFLDIRILVMTIMVNNARQNAY